MAKINIGDTAPDFSLPTDGDGTFSDVSELAGIRVTDLLGRPVAKALSINFFDLDHFVT